MRPVPFALALALAACAEEVPMDAPGGGGGGGGTAGRIDAGRLPPDDGGQTGFTAQLCLISDLRNPTNCASAANLFGTVVENASTGETATANAEGFFTLPTLADASVVNVKVGFADPDLHNVLVPLAVGANSVRIPLVLESTWETLVFTVGLAEPDGTASIAAYLVDNGEPVSGAEVIPPVGGATPVYDGPANANDWQFGGLTGLSGAAIMTGVPAANGDVSFSVSAASELQTITGVPVIDGALTFVTYELQ